MDKLDILDADLKDDKDTVYPEFIPFFSKEGTHNTNPHHHGLFDVVAENLQLSHGMAPWDEYGWSRDGWCI